MNCCGKVCGDSTWDHSKISRWSKGFVKVSTVLKKRTGGILASILREYRHMNGDVYVNFLHRKLRPKIRENWPQLLEAGVLILRENVRSQIAQTIKILFTDHKWEALSHPASLSGYESSVFRSLRETERIAAWPKFQFSATRILPWSDVSGS